MSDRTMRSISTFFQHASLVSLRDDHTRAHLFGKMGFHDRDVPEYRQRTKTVPDPALFCPVQPTENVTPWPIKRLFVYAWDKPYWRSADPGEERLRIESRRCSADMDVVLHHTRHEGIPPSLEDALGYYAKAEAVYSMRKHGIILALSQGCKQVYSLGEHGEVRAIAREYQQKTLDEWRDIEAAFHEQIRGLVT